MDFSNDEKRRIDVLYGTGFAGITPEDGALIARWEAYKAKTAEEYELKQQALYNETEAKIDHSRELVEQTISTLEELRNRAVARLEMIDNGA